MGERRPYESPVRRRQAAETRDRILQAGVALIRTDPTGQAANLTFRSIAESTGLSERTVYRYFASEADLHTAVVRKAELESGVAWDRMRADELPRMVERSIRFFSSPEHEKQAPDTFVEEDSARRQAILAAVIEVTADWPEQERRKAAAVIDALWDVRTYGSLVENWGLSLPEVASAAGWLMALIVEALGSGRRPE